MSELAIVQYFNHLAQGTFIDSITIFISNIPFIIVLWLVLTIYASLTDKVNGWYVFLTVLIALILHFAISEGVFKHGLLTFFDLRTRPYLVDPQNITGLGKLFTDSSFPSSHLASTLAVLTVFVGYYRKVLVPALIFVLLMAFARMHNGMHYPTDILAGTILGIGYGLLALLIIKKIRSRYSKTK